MSQDQPNIEASAAADLRKKTLWAIGATITLATYVFYPVLVQMFRTWRANPDYSHGLLIVPLSLYFAYGKTPQLRRAVLDGRRWAAGTLISRCIAVCMRQLGGVLPASRTAAGPG